MSDKPIELVDDDEPELADLYATWLHEEYTVRTAYGGGEALAILESRIAVAVALIDRLMPRMSGDELLSHIREAEYDCRVAILTAVEPDFDVVRMGFDEYLVKPVRRRELEDTVDALVTRSRYDQQIRTFFALASKCAALESEKPPREFRENDAYADLTAEFDRIRTELERTVNRFRPPGF